MASKKPGRTAALHPMTLCAVSGCTNRLHRAGRPRKLPKDMIFHRFPTNTLSCTTWIKFCENVNLPCQNIQEIEETLAYISSVNNRIGICSGHFEKSCYTVSLKDATKRRLINGACPTLKNVVWPPDEENCGADINATKSVEEPKEPNEDVPTPTMCPYTQIIDDGDEWQYRDLDESMAQLEKDQASSTANSQDLVPKISQSSVSNSSEVVEVNSVGGYVRINEHCYAYVPKNPSPSSTQSVSSKNVLDHEKKAPAPLEKYKMSLSKKLATKAKAPKFSGSEKKLHYEWVKLKRAKTKFDQRVLKFNNRKVTQKEKMTNALGCIKEVLDPAAAEFVSNILLNGEKKNRGRRYSEKMKEICMSLFQYNPRAYNYLRHTLDYYLPCDELLKTINDREGTLHNTDMTEEIIFGDKEESVRDSDMTEEGIFIEKEGSV